MAKLHIPGMGGGVDVDTAGPSRDTQYILAALGRIAQLLEGVINQNDLLIRMESSVLSKTAVKKRILAYQAAEAAAAAPAPKTDLAGVDAVYAEDADVDPALD